MLEKVTKGGNVTEAQTLIRELYPVSVHGGAKGSIWVAYRELKLKSLRRARAIWNGEARRIDGWELDALRERKARQQAHALRQQFISTTEYLRQTDADFHQPTIDALERVTVRIGDVD